MGCGTSKTLNVNADSRDDSNLKQVHNLVDGGRGLKTWSEASEDKQDYSYDVYLTKFEDQGPKPFVVGDSVHVLGYVGVVKYVGSTELGEGEWIGIEMDQEIEQGNDGSYQGIHYFSCNKKRGVFARPTTVFHHVTSQNMKDIIPTISPVTVVFFRARLRRILSDIRRRKLQLRTDIDKTIDAHVRSIPRSKTDSVNKLSQYLAEPFEDLRHRAFAVYRWITTNIFFDVEGYFDQSVLKSTDAESVLRNRVTSSEGYATLFEELCKACKVPTKKVRGFAKGYGYQMRQKISQPNHTWNVIRVNGGKWFICDPTWGAGYIGDEMMFHRDPNIHQFMIQPSVAITSRFPMDETWQLLDQPVTKENFERLAVPSGHLCAMNVALCSHKESMYTASDSELIEITFYGTDFKILKGVLKTCGAGKEIVTPRNMVRVEPNRGNDTVRLTAQFPSAGEFFLDVMVLENSKWEHGVRYCIYSTAGVGYARGGFPSLGMNFYSLGFRLNKPQENIEATDGQCSISLICQRKHFSSLVAKLSRTSNSEMNEADNRKLYISEKTENGFQLRVHFPRKGEYKLSIYAKSYDHRTPDEYLCTYYVIAFKEYSPMAGFPVTSERMRAWGVTFSSHTENIFAENGRCSITLQNPKEIIMSAHLKLKDQDLHGMCSTEKLEQQSTILVHAPKAGIFTLNVFGRKALMDAKSEFLCSYIIKAHKGVSDNPGFPQISELFKTWGLEFVDQRENILSENGRASLALKTPGSILVQATLHKDDTNLPHELCFTDREESISKISVHLPTAGAYKLNMFGRDGPGSKGQFLCSFSILATGGFEENPGFPHVSDEFRAWGLRLESHRQNITVYDGSVAVTFLNPYAIEIFPRLTNEEENQGKLSVNTERMEDRQVIYCQLPEKGRYQLKVFGKNSSEAKKKKFLCSYSIYY